eukprot:EG_transcript_17874
MPPPRFVTRCLLATLSVPALWATYTMREVHRCAESGRVASDTDLFVLSQLPLRQLSRCWGKVNEMEFPGLIQRGLLQLYISMFSVNLQECADVTEYRSLQELFTRRLRAGARPVDEMALLVSPADGVVLHCGPLDGDRLCVKGLSLGRAEFLGGPAASVEPQACCVIYLSPGDYHRFHSPARWRVESCRHIVGQLYSVHPKVLQWLPTLLTLNERCILSGRWQGGQLHFGAVGATNVGSIALTCGPEVRSNRPGDDGAPGNVVREVPVDRPLELQPGDEVGLFRMGSTVVLLFDAPPPLQFCVAAGQRVAVGQALCRLAQ